MYTVSAIDNTRGVRLPIGPVCSVESMKSTIARAFPLILSPTARAQHIDVAYFCWCRTSGLWSVLGTLTPVSPAKTDELIKTPTTGRLVWSQTRARRRCGPMSNYFCHLFRFLSPVVSFAASFPLLTAPSPIDVKTFFCVFNVFFIFQTFFILKTLAKFRAASRLTRSTFKITATK